MPDSTAIPPAGIILKGSRQLTDIDEWHRHAPPKHKSHWKDGRSAKENARAWLRALPGLQPDIARTLAACPDIEPLRHWQAEPEARVRIDAFPGEQPNIDLLLIAEDDHGSIVIAVEAKVDETFGRRLSDQLLHATAACDSKPRSKALTRIEALATQFGLALDRPPHLALRYQLLTATAACLAEAERRSANRAVLIVHDFVTELTDTGKRRRNADDLNHFLKTVFDWRAPLSTDEVVGPFTSHGCRLYVGKSRTRA